MIANYLLHALAWFALRTSPPVRAKRLVDRVGKYMPPIDDRAEARRVADALDRHGTCLSRSLALAARTPGAQVIIAVRGLEPRLSAHAWVELGGVPIRAEDAVGKEIARLG